MIHSKKESKPLSYKEILQELEGILTGRWITDLANISATIFQHIPDINWVGFYLTDPKDIANETAEPTLWLGPFQGLPACTMIPFSKGVCGTAAKQKKSMRIDDVDQFPGHIVCDSRSRSEVVVPILLYDKVHGVLDVDSASLSRFNQEDQIFFEEVIKILVKKSPETL
jgi:L-methionine (R)-S-oxide reductase